MKNRNYAWWRLLMPEAGLELVRLRYSMYNEKLAGMNVLQWINDVDVSHNTRLQDYINNEPGCSLWRNSTSKQSFKTIELFFLRTSKVCLRMVLRKFNKIKWALICLQSSTYFFYKNTYEIGSTLDLKLKIA